MKLGFICLSLLSLAILSSCASTPTSTSNRKVASFENNCAELATKIKDEKVLDQLGCTKDGHQRDVFTASSDWYQDASRTFDEIDTAGIIMDAVQKAHRECSKSHTLCVIKSVSLEYAQGKSDGKRHTSYSVVIHGVDSFISNSDMKKFDADDSNYAGVESTQLQLLSAQYTALSKALNACYGEGYALCAIAGYNLTESNNLRDGKYWTSAAATVIGVNFARPHNMSTAPEKTFKLNHGVPVPTLDLNAVGSNSSVEI